MRFCFRNLTNQFKIKQRSMNKGVGFNFGKVYDPNYNKVYDSNYNLKSFTTSSNGKRDFGRKCN